MGKAINWPLVFREEVLQEDTETLRSAFRVGRLYYDNRYWSDGESVLIRVNHKVVRRAIVAGDLKCCPIKDLTHDDLSAQKSTLQSQEAVIDFLRKTYEKPVTPDTEVTVVYYRNQPIDPEILEIEDDPHMQ